MRTHSPQSLWLGHSPTKTFFSLTEKYCLDTLANQIRKTKNGPVPLFFNQLGWNLQCKLIRYRSLDSLKKKVSGYLTGSKDTGVRTQNRNQFLKFSKLSKFDMALNMGFFLHYSTTLSETKSIVVTQDIDLAAWKETLKIDSLYPEKWLLEHRKTIPGSQIFQFSNSSFWIRLGKSGPVPLFFDQFRWKLA